MVVEEVVILIVVVSWVDDGIEMGGVWVEEDAVVGLELEEVLEEGVTIVAFVEEDEMEATVVEELGALIEVDEATIEEETGAEATGAEPSSARLQPVFLVKAAWEVR